MNQILSKLSWLITARPFITIAVLLAITVVLAVGATLRAPPPETEETLPRGERHCRSDGRDR